MTVLCTLALAPFVLTGCGALSEATSPSATGASSPSPTETTGPDTSSVETNPVSSAATVPATGSAVTSSSNGSVDSTTSTTPPVATTAAPPPTSPATGSGVRALDVLSFIPVTREQGAGYDRELFDHWITQPGGCSTREAVLIRDSLTPAQVDPFGCKVVEGDWSSSYDGAIWQYPSDVDIDHVVALKEAWDSGAWAWTEAQRRSFANDLSDTRTLRAVTDSVNQSKSDKDPSNWLPPLESEWCRYLGDWVAIKARWQLSMDESEAGRIRNVIRQRCPDLTVAPWAPVSVTAPAVVTTPTAPTAPVATSPAAPPTVAPTPPPAPPAAVDVYYANCTAARSAGAAPLYIGDPGYRRALDRDGDGVACE
ncbi:MAG: hypothetical protein RI958_1301 [Actinomycetota bacterium]